MRRESCLAADDGFKVRTKDSVMRFFGYSVSISKGDSSVTAGVFEVSSSVKLSGASLVGFLGSSLGFSSPSVLVRVNDLPWL